MNSLKITPLSFMLIASLLLMVAYSQTYYFPFQFDDYNVIVYEPKVHSLSAWWQSMPSMRSLLKLTYAMNWQLSAQPSWFRVFNLLCHFFSTFLVWRLSLAVLPYLNVKASRHALAACLVALLFALHPAHTEVVTYISSRSTGLMAMLSFAATLLYIRYLESASKRALCLSLLCLSLLCWMLAVLVKEPALILPALWLVLYRLIKPQSAFFQATVFKWLFGFFFILCILYLWAMPQYARLITRAWDWASLQSQLLTQPVAHLHYLSHTLLGLNLSVDYRLIAPQAFSVLGLIAATVLLLVIPVAFIYLKKSPLICFCVLWWFVCLLPSNSLIPRVDLVNDRQIYMASFGALLLLAVAVAELVARYKLAWLLPVLLLSASLIATWHRNADYESEISLWQSSLKHNKYNARAWNNLGYAYMLDKQDKKAIHAFENALELDEDNVKALYNLQSLKQH